MSGAKSANERQETPSKKSCYTKIEIVSCVAIQHSATVGSFTISIFALVKLTLLNCFNKALAFRTDRLCREVGPGSRA
jgi:hypothetical protein